MIGRGSPRAVPVTVFDRWLLVAAVLFGLQGLSWVVLGRFDAWGIWDRLLAATLFDGTTPPAVARFRAFLLGPFGATIAGYYLLVACIVAIPFRRRERWAFWAVSGAVWLWFTVDTAASIAHGVWFNVWLVNVPCVTIMTIPLVALYSRFRYHE